MVYGDKSEFHITDEHCIMRDPKDDSIMLFNVDGDAEQQFQQKALQFKPHTHRAEGEIADSTGFWRQARRESRASRHQSWTREELEAFGVGGRDW
jgi:hypothetical protein